MPMGLFGTRRTWEISPYHRPSWPWGLEIEVRESRMPRDATPRPVLPHKQPAPSLLGSAANAPRPRVALQSTEQQCRGTCHHPRVLHTHDGPHSPCSVACHRSGDTSRTSRRVLTIDGLTECSAMQRSEVVRRGAADARRERARHSAAGIARCAGPGRCGIV